LKSIEIVHPCTDFMFRKLFSEPQFAIGFLNAVMKKSLVTGHEIITSVQLIEREMLSNIDNTSVIVDVRCVTNKNRHFLIEMQNDFREHYYMRMVVDHSASIIELNNVLKKQALQKVSDKFAVRSTALRNMWNDIDGIFSIVVTNKRLADKKDRYRDESWMEPDLINPYELRHTGHLSRHFGDMPSQVIVFSLANFPVPTDISQLQDEDYFALLFHEPLLETGTKIPSKKSIEIDMEALGKASPIVKHAFEIANTKLPENAQFLERVERENERLRLRLEDAFVDGKMDIMRHLKETSSLPEKDIKELCEREGIRFEDL
jgi:hypothetical protein